MIPDNLTPEQETALDELFHQCDLISTRPLPCEIEWALSRTLSVGRLTERLT